MKLKLEISDFKVDDLTRGEIQQALYEMHDIFEKEFKYDIDLGVITKVIEQDIITNHVITIEIVPKNTEIKNS